MPALDALIKAANAFRDERDWRKFHAPKNLAITLALEAAEVLEHFQWRTDAEAATYLRNGGTLEIRKELADVLVNLLYLADELGVDLEQAVFDKLEENRRKYPVELAKGRADKYTAYQT